MDRIGEYIPIPLNSKRREDIMDFQLTKEQQMLKKMAAQFAVQYCEPEAAELDETHEFLHGNIEHILHAGELKRNTTRKSEDAKY